MKSNVKVITKLILIVAFFMLLTPFVWAQSEVSNAFSVTGSVDTYFRTNLNSTNDPTNGGMVAPGTSFANLPGFSLGMANIVGSFESEKAGVVLDLVFGPRGVDAVFGSVAPLNLVNQMYAYWNMGERITVTFGNFNTFLGYEIIAPTGNFNYSTSYMFSYGPFSHSGLKADMNLGGGFSFMAGVFNPTDATDFNPDNHYYGGSQLAYSRENGNVFLNTLFANKFYQVDLTTGWDVSEKAHIGFNSTIASDNFIGLAGYFQVAFFDEFSLGIRGEYFTDNGIGVLSLDESVVDLTFSANYRVGNLMLIPEFRTDSFTEKGFVIVDAHDPGNIKTANALSSFVLAAVYAF